MTTFAPGYTFEDYPQGRTSLSIDQQIDAFEKQYRQWLLNYAQKLTDNDINSGFAVLAITNSYFEMVARHYQGKFVIDAKGKAGTLTKEGLKLVFPNLSSPIVKKLYEGLRCVVAHLGLTGSQIYLNPEPPLQSALKVELNPDNSLKMIYINPSLWVEAIEKHFTSYIAELKNPDNNDLRQRFSKCYLSGLEV